MQSQPPPPPPRPSNHSTLYFTCSKQGVLSIDCLAVHPELPLCASGQAAGRTDRDLDGTHVQVTQIHSLNMEVDLQSLFGLNVT